jgi:hypothetical protein
LACGQAAAAHKGLQAKDISGFASYAQGREMRAATKLFIPFLSYIIANPVEVAKVVFFRCTFARKL